ncbi:prepilin-type N-terminal cleavage/methylation domain-containing protein [Sphingomonas sp. LR61]|uniref:type IV pilus modification PilV family protein n=1 Tax=Sphingomonas sp. LR61 TaxID=3050234 RepID=UPI002FE40108
MLLRIVDRLRAARESEEGFSIIEVMVAMTIFAMIAAGVAAGIVSTLYLTQDNRSREAALNLANQALDAARSTKDVFTLDDDTTLQSVGNQAYTIKQTTNWINSDGSDNSCGAGSRRPRLQACVDHRLLDERYLAATEERRPRHLDLPFRGGVERERVHDRGRGPDGDGRTELRRRRDDHARVRRRDRLVEPPSGDRHERVQLRGRGHTGDLQGDDRQGREHRQGRSDRSFVVGGHHRRWRRQRDLPLRPGDHRDGRHPLNLKDGLTAKLPTSLPMTYRYDDTVQTVTTTSTVLFPYQWTAIAGAYTSTCKDVDPTAWPTASNLTTSPNIFNALDGSTPGTTRRPRSPPPRALPWGCST